MRLKVWKMKPSLCSRSLVRPSSSSVPAGRLAVDADRALGRDVHAADEVEQRRLAAARRAGDRHELARVDGQIHAAQRAHGQLPQRVVLLDPANLDHWLA
jgi:hypothetical protein